MKNKLISIFIVITIIFSSITAINVLADENAVSIYLEDVKFEFGSNKPVSIDGAVYVPIMDFMKDMDIFDVVYDNEKQIIAISGTTTKVSFEINNMTVGSQPSSSGGRDYSDWSFTDPNYPRLINNVPYVSIKALAKAIGWGVRWDNTKKAVVIMNSRTSYVDGKVFKTFMGKLTDEANSDDIVFDRLVGISSSEDGTIYAGKYKGLIKISNGKTEIFPLEFSPSNMRCKNGNIYFKNVGENKVYKFDGKNMTLIIDGGVYGYQSFYDFYDYDIDSKGNVYTTCKDDSGIYLCKIDTFIGNMTQIQKLGENEKLFHITVDNYDNLYISSSEGNVYGNSGESVIYYYNFTDKTFKVCAGLKGQKKWRDSNSVEDICFYNPGSMRYSNGYLYVDDRGRLRRVTVDKGIATKAETIVGGEGNNFSPDIAASAKAFNWNTVYEFTVVGDKIYFLYWFDSNYFIGVIE